MLLIINGGPPLKRKRSTTSSDFTPEDNLNIQDICEGLHQHPSNDISSSIVKRQTVYSPGYNTTDDFGNDGDDTTRSEILTFEQPEIVQGRAAFSNDGTYPTHLDVVFAAVSELEAAVLRGLKETGGNFSSSDVQRYTAANVTVGSALLQYAQRNWQAGMPNCSSVTGIGT
jgi:hypothetical protein